MPDTADFDWISDPQQLAERLAGIHTRVGLDTEFIRERTYWPQLALVQIAIERPGQAPDILLVDTLAPGIRDALRSLLADTSITKIMHSASEDLVAFKHACGVVPEPLFDTQIAAALSGVGAGMGYQRLVAETLGLIVDKGETRSDWTRRPLSDSQLQYAAYDVLHLFALHDALADKLAALSREAWLREDSARLVAANKADERERWPHMSMRTSQFLDRDGHVRLLRLLRWRDTYARDHDRPRSWILDNELATLLARDPPADIEALQGKLDAHPKSPRKLTALLWQALTTPLADEAEMPEPRTEELDKQALKRLQQAVAQRSADLGLPDGVLASRRWLEAMLEGSPWPGAMAGWRRQQLEAQLSPLLPAAAPAR